VVTRIISGGQTGADRAALDVGLALGIEIGGWIPRGRRAEDGAIPARYAGLAETDSVEYAVRTRLNVRDADATLILTFGSAEGGTALTEKLAKNAGKPVLVIDFDATACAEAIDRVARWLSEANVRTLNVAGPRLSKEPRIQEAAEDLLRAVLG
jgi:hypothetical protein